MCHTNLITFKKFGKMPPRNMKRCEERHQVTLSSTAVQNRNANFTPKSNREVWGHFNCTDKNKWLKKLIQFTANESSITIRKLNGFYIHFKVTTHGFQTFIEIVIKYIFPSLKPVRVSLMFMDDTQFYQEQKII